MIAYQIAQIVSYAIDFYCLLIIIRCLLSFFTNIDRGHPAVRMLITVTDPLLEPVSRIMPPIAGLDLSPMVVIVVLRIFQSVMLSALYGH